MGDLLDIALVYPTVGYTLLLALACLYWVFVILGALDIDTFDFELHADGAVEGAAEGAAEAAAEGAAEAAAEAAEGAAEAAGDHVETAGGLLGLLVALRLRNAPVTVVFSFLMLFGWTGSLLGSHYLGATGWLMGTLVGFGALALAVFLTALVTRPMRPLFQTRGGTRRQDLVAGTCEITTGRVDEGFGQAEATLGSDHLLIQVRCDPELGLRKGQQALIIDYANAREAYQVAPLDRGI